MKVHKFCAYLDHKSLAQNEEKSDGPIGFVRPVSPETMCPHCISDPSENGEQTGCDAKGKQYIDIERLCHNMKRK